MTFKEKIKNLLKQNGISEFVYHSTCYGDGPQLPFAVSTYGIINGLIKFIDFRTIKSITGFEVQNFKSKVLFLKKDGKWIKSSYTIYQTFNNGVCPNYDIREPYTDETEDEHIYNILLQHFNYENKKGKDKSFENIRNNVAKQLAHHFYQDVNTCVYIKQLDFNGVKINEDKLKTNYDKPCDITLNITIKPDGSVNIKHVMADNYLKDKVKTLQEEANKRGLKISVEELRQQVIKDFESIETEQSFYKKFIVGWQKLIGEGVANYVEGIQATQKIGKNIWSEGTINHSTWYSKSNEHKEWPEWVQFNPLIGGVLDGTIDEIVGIPVALKGVYEIATDPKKQEALKGVFTKDGIKNLVKGLGDEVKDTYNDPEKGEHFVGQTTVAVASMLIPGMQITKTGKLGKVLDEATEGVKKFANPKVLKSVEELKTTNKYLPEENKLVEKFLKETDGEILDELADDLPKIIGKGDEFALLQKARKLPGTSKGLGKEIKGKWLKGTEGNAGLFPKSVAEKLKGQSFNNFDDFRAKFWKTVAEDEDLIKDFSESNKTLMRQGNAPFPLKNQRLGGQETYQLHHKTPINQGGEVYDMDNMIIVTPRFHKEILSPKYHYGYNY